ncbi:MAG: glycosyltransferase [Fervidobacterium sp.]
MRKKAIHQRNIHILGYVPREKIPVLLRAADAFISLSCYEGLPLTVLEAASFNLPLILSDIPAHRWIINSGIGYGELVNSRNPNLVKILNFIESGIEVKKPLNEPSMRYYAWDNIVRQYLKLLCA